MSSAPARRTVRDSPGEQFPPGLQPDPGQIHDGPAPGEFQKGAQLAGIRCVPAIDEHGGGHRQQWVRRLGNVTGIPDRDGQIGQGERLDQGIEVVGGLTANDQGHFLEVDLMAVGLHGVEGGPPVEGGDLIGIGAQEHDPGRVVAA